MEENKEQMLKLPRPRDTNSLNKRNYSKPIKIDSNEDVTVRKRERNLRDLFRTEK